MGLCERDFQVQNMPLRPLPEMWLRPGGKFGLGQGYFMLVIPAEVLKLKSEAV